MHRDFEMKPDDRVSMAIHVAEREQAVAALRSRGFEVWAPGNPD